MVRSSYQLLKNKQRYNHLFFDQTNLHLTRRVQTPLEEDTTKLQRANNNDKLIKQEIVLIPGDLTICVPKKKKI